MNAVPMHATARLGSAFAFLVGVASTTCAQVRVLEHCLSPAANAYPIAGYHDRTRGVDVFGDQTGVFGWAGKGQVNRDAFPGTALLSICEFPRSPGDLMAFLGLPSTLLRYRDNEWTPVPPTMNDPGGYLDVHLGYDPQRQVAMLYQSSIGAGSETWEFDGSTWTRLAQSTGRLDFVAIYHQARRQRMHGIDRLGRVFEWVAPNWSQIDAIPASHNATVRAAAYHRGRQMLEVACSSPTATVMRTYEHDGSTFWVFSHTYGPIWTPSANWSLMVYDEARGESILFGPDRTQAWAFSGAGWTDLGVPNAKPSARNDAMLANEAFLGSILFGGHDASGVPNAETWAWNGEQWFQLAPTASPPARASGAMAAYGGSNGRVLLFGGIDGSGTPLGDTWHLSGNTWAQGSAAGGPTPRLNHAMAYDASVGQTFLFGGTDYGQWFGDFYGARFGASGPVWTALPPGPPARDIHAMAFDRARRRLVVFGGRDASGSEFADTWEYAPDLGTWTQRTPSHAPHARVNHAMVYDEARARTVLLAGYSWTVGYLSDIWEWDGTDWTQRVPETDGIEPTENLAAAYDPRTRRIVAFGGLNAFGAPPTDRTYELCEPTGPTVANQGAPLALRMQALPLVGAGRSPLEIQVDTPSGAAILALAFGRAATPAVVGAPPLWCSPQPFYVTPVATLFGVGSPTRFTIPVPQTVAGTMVSFQALAVAPGGCLHASEARFALVRSTP